MRTLARLLLGLSLLPALAACDEEPELTTTEPPSPPGAEVPEAPRDPPAFALAIHGGAGSITREGLPADRRAAYVRSLSGALREGCARLESGTSSVEVVAAVVQTLEEDPLFNAGRGAVMNAEGHHELDASIMRGADLGCGAVAAVTRVRNPIRLALEVMDHSPHVLLMGAGAERFAEERGLPLVDNELFTTPRRREQYERRRAEADADEHGTVGAVALDRGGHLAAATSTGGLSFKQWGRVGDSPIIGAGTYADDRTCAVSCTGIGEEFIRHGIARMVSARMQLAGEAVGEAAARVLRDRTEPGTGGLIAVAHDGAIAFESNTAGMFRGRCGEGVIEVRIWDEPEPLTVEPGGPARLNPPAR